MKKDDVFRQVIAQMARWTLDRSDQGPVYLGYRLGHIRNDGRVFRALVYNKGALTLHMLRKLIGDDAFFRGLRRFYATWRFKKAGTEDVKAAFELEANRDLDRVLRSLDLRIVAAAHEVQLHDRARRGGRAVRADRRAVRGAGHGDAEVRRVIDGRDGSRHRAGDDAAHSDHQARPRRRRERR